MERQDVSGKANSSRRSWAFVPRPLSLHCHWSQSQSPTKFDVSLLMIWAHGGRKCMKQQESSFHFISSFQRIPKFGVPTNSAQIFQNELFFQTSRHLPLGSPLYAGTVHESQGFFSHSDLDRSVDVLPFCQVSSLGRALCGLWLPRHRGEEGRRMQLKRRFAEIVSLHFSAQAQVKCIYIYILYLVV